jgi:Tfp pilus assembly protein PilN
VSRDFSTRPAAPPRSPLDLALVAAGLVALAWSGACAHGSWRDARDRRARAEEARRELAAVRERSSVTASATEAAFARQALLSLEATPPVVLAALASVLPPDVRLDGLTLRYGGSLDLRLQVVARDAAAYDLFLSRLEASPRFRSVTLGEENRDGEVRASVSASFGSPAP